MFSIYQQQKRQLCKVKDVLIKFIVVNICKIYIHTYINICIKPLHCTP